jgi:DhnA family fructose-bisphosphate aldolase class Ia
MTKERRLGRLFRKSGKTLILAIEHTGIFGPGKGLEDPAKTIERVIDTGYVDGVMTTFGIAKEYASLLSGVGLILRSDGAPTILGPNVPAPVWFGVEEALKLGADGLCISAYPGTDLEMDTLNNLVEIAREAEDWGVALQAEMVPGGMMGDGSMRTPKNIAHSARLGIELGADWVKVPYCTPFSQVTAPCFKPVVIMGGSRNGAEGDFLKDLKGAMEEGASGGTIGRYIFESDHPEKMATALGKIIHEGIGVDEACDLIS